MTKSGDETFKGHTSRHPSTGSSCSVCFNWALKRSASHVTPLSRCEVGTWPVNQHGWRRLNRKRAVWSQERVGDDKTSVMSDEAW